MQRLAVEVERWMIELQLADILFTCVVAFLRRPWLGAVQGRAVRGAIQAGLLPISISTGLIAASAFVVASVAVHNLTAVLIVAITAVVTCMPRLNPLWIFVAAALAGLTGWLRLKFVALPAAHRNVLLEKICQGDRSFPAPCGSEGSSHVRGR